MATKKYIEQVRRMERMYQRFKSLNVGVEHTQASPNYDDDVYSFFQNCYHLKDWIKNDPYCAAWQDVEAFINSNEDLKICADLCNSLKHLDLTRPRSTENPQFHGGAMRLDIHDGSGSSSVKIAMSFNIVTTSQGSIDAFDLATRCVDAWKNFIAVNDP